MTDPRTAIRGLHREAGAVLRPLGFRGSRGTWTITTGLGLATVAVQAWKSRDPGVLRPPGTPDAYTLSLSAAVLPRRWWEFREFQRRHWGSPSWPIEREQGINLVEHHPLPGDPPHGLSWQVPTGDPAEIGPIRAELLPATGRRGARVLELLHPRRYAEALLAQPDPGIGGREAIVVLLAGEGPGPQLDEAVEHYRAAAVAHAGWGEYAEVVLAWTKHASAPA